MEACKHTCTNLPTFTKMSTTLSDNKYFQLENINATYSHFSVSWFSVSTEEKKFKLGGKCSNEIYSAHELSKCQKKSFSNSMEYSVDINLFNNLNHC